MERERSKRDRARERKQLYKRSAFTFLFNGSLYAWVKIKMRVTSAYIECATGKCYYSIELTDSFLLKYRYWTFAMITASAFNMKAVLNVQHPYTYAPHTLQ